MLLTDNTLKLKREWKSKGKRTGKAERAPSTEHSGSCSRSQRQSHTKSLTTNCIFQFATTFRARSHSETSFLNQTHFFYTQLAPYLPVAAPHWGKTWICSNGVERANWINNKYLKLMIVDIFCFDFSWLTIQENVQKYFVMYLSISEYFWAFLPCALLLLKVLSFGPQFFFRSQVSAAYWFR